MELELLAPAGNFEKLKVAFHYGADAVYVGLDKLSLRANADNFTRDELKRGVIYAHSLQKKIYVALNIYFTPEQTDKIIDALQFLASIKPDGIILSDMGALQLVKKIAPSLPIHISTQANCTNQYAAAFFQSIGIKRVVLARELTLEGIKAISDFVGEGLELEAFVHGAMCIAYSGRCILSSYMTSKGLGARENAKSLVRSANKGDCAHSCRWEFILKEKTRRKDEFEIEEDENGSYILSSKDICMIEHIRLLINAGIGSFKIEGRMKSILYISSIVRAYRYVLDCLIAGKEDRIDMAQIDKELNIVSHREFSTGFFFSSPKKDGNIAASVNYERNVRLVGLILSSGEFSRLKLYNKVTVDDKLEMIGRNMKTISIDKIEFFDKEKKQVREAKHTDEIQVRMYDKEHQLIFPEALDILRMEASF